MMLATVELVRYHNFRKLEKEHLQELKGVGEAVAGVKP